MWEFSGNPEAEIAKKGKVLYNWQTMSKVQDHLIIVRNKETKEVYHTTKNKKKVARKLELKKYSKKLRKHVTFKEAKK